MKKLLLNDEDLKTILHIDSDTILDMVSKGMPHYYFEDHFYFNYPEVQDWISETVELGYIESQYQGVTNYLEATLKENIDMQHIREQLRLYIQNAKGLSDDKLVWLYNNCSGDKYTLFCKYIETCFPGIEGKNIYKYYFALLKTLIDTGAYKDSLNNYIDT